MDFSFYKIRSQFAITLIKLGAHLQFDPTNRTHTSIGAQYTLADAFKKAVSSNDKELISQLLDSGFWDAGLGILSRELVLRDALKKTTDPKVKAFLNCQYMKATHPFTLGSACSIQ